MRSRLERRKRDIVAQTGIAAVFIACQSPRALTDAVLGVKIRSADSGRSCSCADSMVASWS
jgi:hypothetical protein